ncbi:MAG TPA: tripartite tricarboxylate transporter substrate binding protein [Xanthobacteraceae bacterium]|nr:tripartite tricarboxylate transporter substrate binding protein [Xanthobacteraceae bacterium]
MKLPRRTFLHIAAGATALPLLSRLAWSLDYPTRPVRVIVGFPAGSGPDVIARLIGQRIGDRLGQQFFVENRSGAGSSLAAQDVVAAPADGYTLLLTANANAVNASLYPNLPFNFVRDIAAVGMICSAPFLLTVNPAVPAKTFAEFIAYAKANPGKLNYGSSGPGSSPHLAAELFDSIAGIRMTHVPYKGVSQYITAQIGGEIQFSFSNMFTTMPHWKSGRLHLIATGGPKRMEAMPDLPTVAESGVPGFEAMTWYGYMAPAKTPRAIVDRLQKEIAAIVNLPDVRQTFVSQGNKPLANTPAEFAKVIKNDADKWGALGKKLGVKLD